MLIRDRNATADPHGAGYLKVPIAGVAPKPGDEVVFARFQAFVDNESNSEVGLLSLYRLNDASWDETTLDYSNRPYTATDPMAGGSLDPVLSHDFGQVAVTINDGDEVGFDLAGLTNLNQDHAFLLLAADVPDPGASGTAKNGNQRHYIHTSEASLASLAPRLAISYTTSSPVTATPDSLTVAEGGNSLLSPLRLTENDFPLDPSAPVSVAEVNGIAWASLPDSSSDLYQASFGYKQVAGAHGIFYLRDSGLVYYDHNGSNLPADSNDSLTYKLANAGFVSPPASLTVTLLAGNQAPGLAMEAKNFIPSVAAASAGDIAATYAVTDPDGDATLVGWLNEGGTAPTDGNGDALYAIDPGANAVRLTAAGAALANTPAALPPILLAAFDQATVRKPARATAHPYVAPGTAYYIDRSNGNDANDGLSPATAFATVDRVLDSVAGVQFLQPGDTVFIIGEYTAPDFNLGYTYGGNPTDPYIWRNDVTTIKIRNIHGSAGLPITLKAWDSNTIVRSDDTAGISVDSSSHIRVIGFEVEGAVGRISDAVGRQLQFLYRVDTTEPGYQRADYDVFAATDGTYDYFYRVPLGSTVEDVEANYATPGTLNQISKTQRPIYTDTKGILIRDSQYVDVLHNHVHHVQSTGIRSERGEMVNIIGNEVHNATRKASVGTMGIVARETTDLIPVLPDKSNLYKIVIANNRVHHVYNEIYSWVPTKTFITPHLDEGKGISLEWQDDPSWYAPGATGRILMANNVTWLNALSGVNNHGGDRVDVIHNTAFLNSLYLSVFELEAGNNLGVTHEPDNNGSVDLGTDVRYWNNLSVTDGSENGFAVRVNAGSARVASGFVTYDGGGNMVWEYRGGTTKKDDLNVADGLFLADADPLIIDPARGDFRIPSSSPARDAALPLSSGWHLPDVVAADACFVARNTADVGALEFVEPQCGYTAWLREHLTAGEIEAGLLLAPGDDFDGDGLPNLHEYAFGTLPDSATDSSNALQIDRQLDGSLTLTYTRPEPMPCDLIYEIQKSDNLEVWETLDETQFTPSQSMEGDLLRITLDMGPSSSAPERCFYRLRITLG